MEIDLTNLPDAFLAEYISIKFLTSKNKPVSLYIFQGLILLLYTRYYYPPVLHHGNRIWTPHLVVDWSIVRLKSKSLSIYVFGGLILLLT
jgi:hypothetical protein